MTTDKSGQLDKAPSPQIYAGLKFYDRLMAKIAKIEYFSMASELYMWYISLEDYVSITSKFMGAEDRTAITKEMETLRKQIWNYMAYQDKLGPIRTRVQATLRNSLVVAQTNIFNATSALLMKTSEGASMDLDFTALSRGE